MSSVALALPSEQARTGPLLRLSAAAGAVGTGLVVASAALELGAAHWSIVALTLPFLVVNVGFIRGVGRDPDAQIVSTAGFKVAEL